MLRRLTSLTLTIYVLILLSQPCQDVFARPVEVAPKHAISMQAEIPSEPCSDAETCSPFCICSCCSLSVAHCNLTANLTTNARGNAEPSRISSYTNPSATAFLNSIWQPPKA